MDAPTDTTSQPLVELDPLILTLTDEKLLGAAKRWLSADQKHYENKFDLKIRRERNKKFFYGRQYKGKDYRSYERPYSDNILWEIASSLKPLALSRLPDLIIQPGTESPESAATADSLSDAINSEMHARDRRRVASLAFRHYPIFLTAVVKARWDPERGGDGDYIFEVVHPDNIVVSRSARANDAREMLVIQEKIPLTIKEVLMRFPEKKDKLIDELKARMSWEEEDEQKESKLATEIEVWEVHFTWYESRDDKYSTIEGVMWRYEDCLLGKMKDPNWDWEGTDKLFTYDVPGDASTKRELDETELRDMIVTGDTQAPVVTETVYHNYLEQPEKPYFFMGYEQGGESYLDETTWLEQLIAMQEDIDEQGFQTTQMLKNRGTHVYSKESGLKKEDIEEIDPQDPDTSIVVDGKVNETHAYIQHEQPNQAQFANYQQTRDRMFAKGGVQASRGEVESDVATTNQIAREANFTRADDVVEDTINPLFEWMARWSLQFIKLRYTSEHFRRLQGDAGQTAFMKLHRDMIEDGMEVTIKASGTDKLKAEQRAKDMASLTLIDPMSYFEDIGASDPKGRTEKLIAFQTNPQLYMQTYVSGAGTEGLIDQLNGDGSAEAQQAIAMLEQGQQPPLPAAVTPAYQQTLLLWMQAPEFAMLPPETQQIALQFIEQMGQVPPAPDPAMAQGGALAAPGMAPSQPPEKPSAGNTSAIPPTPTGPPTASPRSLTA